MNRTDPQATSAPQSPSTSVYWAACGLALAAYLLELFLLLTSPNSTDALDWSEPVLLVTATFATLTSLRRQLPVQNVLLAASIIAFIGTVAHGICTATAIPFGPMGFAAAGPSLFGDVSWGIPFLWVAAILTSRGVARLILRPWRRLRNYGYWWIGLTAVLITLFDFTLEPFAAQVKHYWVWRETRFPLTWYGMPLINSVGWFVTSILILAFATPALVNKKPRSRHSPPNYFPLIAWVLGVLLFALGAATQNLWPAVTVCASAAIIVTVFAVRGARW